MRNRKERGYIQKGGGVERNKKESRHKNCIHDILCQKNNLFNKIKRLTLFFINYLRFLMTKENVSYNELTIP